MLAHLGTVVSGGTSNWSRCRCPFHDDKTASASINRAKQAFNCHGCGIAGDVVSLAMAHLETEDVKQALEWLEDTFAN